MKKVNEKKKKEKKKKGEKYLLAKNNISEIINSERRGVK